MTKRVEQLSFFIFTIMCFFLFVVGAAHVVHFSSGQDTLSILEDSSTMINVSVINGDAGESANITQLNITLENGLTFTSGTNGSDAGEHVFTVSENTLSWSNFSHYLINGGVTKHFQFSVGAVNPGNFDITIRTLNGSGISSSTLTVVVNDTTAPSTVFFVTPSNNVNLSINYIIANVSITDNGDAGAITIYLFNNTNILINSSASTGSSSKYVNFTGLSDGAYYLNATANDSYGNSNYSQTIRVRIDTGYPTVTIDENSAEIEEDNVFFEFTAGDNSGGTGIRECDANRGTITNNTNLTSTNLDCGEDYTFQITCSDYAGNENSDSFSVETDSCDESGDSSSSSSSGSDDSSDSVTWTNTFDYNDEEFSEKDEIEKELKEKERIKIKFEGTTHYVGVINITDEFVEISVSSDVQEATIKKGEAAKFDIDDDSYYDVLVEITDILSSTAKLKVSYIHEFFEDENLQMQTNDDTNTNSANSQNSFEEKRKSLAYVAAIAAAILAAGVATSFYIVYKKRNGTWNMKK